jgi:diguanylate cyclase (GGDEF)-like protein
MTQNIAAFSLPRNTKPPPKLTFPLSATRKNEIIAALDRAGLLKQKGEIMTQSIAEKFQEFKAHGKLPSPRGVALQIIKLANNENTTTQQISNLISKDPALAGRIVKAANLLVQNAARPIASISDAVTVLGLKSVRQLALSLSLVADFRSGMCKGFDYQRFWAHSACSAITAQKIVTQLRAGVADEAFLLGLLAQIGRLAMATIFPQNYSQVLEKSASTHNLDELETEAFGISHNQLTALMLADWGLPDLFQHIAIHLEHPEKSNLTEGDRSWFLLQLFHFADCLAEVCTATPYDRYRLIPKLLRLATRVGIETKALIEVGDHVAVGLRDWGSLLNITMPALPAFNEILNANALNPEHVGVNNLANTQLAAMKLRILLVGKNNESQRSHQALLEKTGHAVTVAKNADEALAQIKVRPPQLIISHLSLQGMDGIACCKALRNNPEWHKIFVFILTDQESTDRLMEIFDAGANDYLLTPINEKILAARISAAQRIIHMQETQEEDRMQLRQFADELALSNQRLQVLALTDELTDLPNRRYGIERLEQEWAVAMRGSRPVSCMMIDIDHFKSINDQYGHPVGDQALKLVAQSLRQAARKQDIVCRLGGEEFLVICPDTDSTAGYQYAERLRHFVSVQTLSEQGGKIHFTISIGLTDNHGLNSAEAMLHQADERLYAAKAGGRNRTVGA